MSYKTSGASNSTNDSKINSKISKTSGRNSQEFSPSYFIGGCNGTNMLDKYLGEVMGWRRTKDRYDDSYRLKWVELKSTINYNSFKEGEQMVNHIPNCQLLTNKLGLLNTLESYGRAACHSNTVTLKHSHFLPQTFRLGEPKQREYFWAQYKEDDLYICKPTARNQGKGIFIVTSRSDLNDIIQAHDAYNEQNIAAGKAKCTLHRIIQRYIRNPLLIHRRKFDIRAYMLVANTVPYLVLYQKGYVRLSIHDYDNNYSNLIAHLTNQFVQKKDPSYKNVKDDTTWSFDQLNNYINENEAVQRNLPLNWVYGNMTNQIKKIMNHCFKAAKHRFFSKIGYFELYGFDFMIDDNMKTWLIEVNVNPCLATNCKALAAIIPKVTQDTLNVSIECFNKARRSKPLLPLQCQHDFDILFHDDAEVKKGFKNDSGKLNSPTADVAPKHPPHAHVKAAESRQQTNASLPTSTTTCNSTNSSTGDNTPANNDTAANRDNTPTCTTKHNNNNISNITSNNNNNDNDSDNKEIDKQTMSSTTDKSTNNNESKSHNTNNNDNNNTNINSNNNNNVNNNNNNNINNNNNNNNSNNNNGNTGRSMKTISAAAEASLIRLARPYRQKPPVNSKPDVDAALTSRTMVLPRATVSYDKKPLISQPLVEKVVTKSPYSGEAILLKMTHTMIASGEQRSPSKPFLGKEKRFRGS